VASWRGVDADALSSAVRTGRYSLSYDSLWIQRTRVGFMLSTATSYGIGIAHYSVEGTHRVRLWSAAKLERVGRVSQEGSHEPGAFPRGPVGIRSDDRILPVAITSRRLHPLMDLEPAVGYAH